MKTLTEIQRRVLNAVRQRIEAGEPPPSYRDLCGEFGWSSTRTARDHLRALQQKGYVDLPRRRGGRVTLRHEKASSPAGSGDVNGTGPPAPGMSPYATGGGGVTFERKVAVQYLARLLVGDGAVELGDGRRVLSVAFQQAPEHPVDDLVVSAARPDEREPSRVLALAIRRAPRLVASNKSTRKLVRAFVDAIGKAPTGGPEHRWCLVVAGSQPHAEQLAELAAHAATQMDTPGFFDLIRTPGKFNADVRRRLDQIEKLVQRALHDLGRADVRPKQVRQHVWRLLAGLSVSMPRLEPPDAKDWAEVANHLIPVARDSDLAAASRLRDRLVTLAAEYSPKSARVDLTVLRRDAIDTLNPAARRQQRGWEALHHLHRRALASVRNEIKEIDGDRCLRLDRKAAAAALAETVAGAAAVVVGGESGVGKSALALSLADTDATDADRVQALCIDLRHVHKLTVDFQTTLGCPLSTLLCELSAPQRMLIIDGADAVAEGRADALRYLVDAAHASDVKVVAVASVDNKQVVWDKLADRFGTDVKEYAVAPLTDAEIAQIVTTFGELAQLSADPRPRELLRRLVVVDLLVRGGISGVPLTDADAMREVWSSLVRRRGMSNRGSPDAREWVLLQLAALALNDVGDMERLGAVQALNSAALQGLRLDGLLRVPADDAFGIGPEFGHDEVRRYAVARLLWCGRHPASRIMEARAPRWSLAAARLACQALLAEPDTSASPLRGRFADLQASFDAIVAAGHGTRWGDVPSEAMLRLANPGTVLRDAWPTLSPDDAPGLPRLARLIKQQLTTDGIVDIVAVEPIITLLLEDSTLWRPGDVAKDLLRDWLRAHVVANTTAGHRLRILLRERLVETCAAADRRLIQEREAAAPACAPRPPEAVQGEHPFAEITSEPSSEVGYGHGRRRERAEIAPEITDEIVVELLALLGPDLGKEGELILRRIAHDVPTALAPAVEARLTGQALAGYCHSFLVHLTLAYYLDDETDDGSGLSGDGIREHDQRFAGDQLTAWHLGPFMPLFQTGFRQGAATLNHLLNHAADAYVRNAIRGRPSATNDVIGACRVELAITGTRQIYFGDKHVWGWYSGNEGGPFPCLSALGALERVCDHMIKDAIPIRGVVSTLLDGCKSLAMVGLVVGLLVRHLENAGDLLDPYLTEPVIWCYEFDRAAKNYGTHPVDSAELVKPDRRNWSLRRAAVFMVWNAKGERVAELRALGEMLVENASRQVHATRDDEAIDVHADTVNSVERKMAIARAWASNFNRDRFQVVETSHGSDIHVAPPQDVMHALWPGYKNGERTQEKARLFARYYGKAKNKRPRAFSPDELAADMATARRLLDQPPFPRTHDLWDTHGLWDTEDLWDTHDPWDAIVLVASAVLEAQLLGGSELPEDVLSFAADAVLRTGEEGKSRRQQESKLTFFEGGADLSAAKALPLLFLPVAAGVRALVDHADGWATFERAVCAGLDLARAPADDVGLRLARGLDHVWQSAWAGDGRCHHEVALQLALETMRNCVLGSPDPHTGRRPVVALEEPLIESLASTEGSSILESRLDAAIRALAPATVADICVSNEARAGLSTLLDAQRRSLLSRDRNENSRGSHGLESARALLTLAAYGDEVALWTHIDAYADDSALVAMFLKALSAVAEETTQLAATARGVWRKVVRHVLELDNSGHALFRDHRYGIAAIAALMPNPTVPSEPRYLYREVQDKPIAWWKPLALVSEVKAWLEVAAGSAMCADQLVGFLRVLSPEDQVRTGLEWVATLVLADPARIAGETFLLTKWLIEGRAAADEARLLEKWQEVVDALVVAGDTHLAPYSE
ncbi:MAG: hypothetical protein OXG04_00430 [Acidobacteria bacterium]|nr:hypothetical protein [Acidobacteriota bacterium]